jgi:hypothetical protein
MIENPFGRMNVLILLMEKARHARYAKLRDGLLGLLARQHGLLRAPV